MKKASVLNSLSNAVRTLAMVGVTGFEPMASWSRTKRDTKLRHTPKCLKNYILLSRKLQEIF